MRIISGSLKGKKLLSPQNQTIRPTLDRHRESIFNILDHAPWAQDLRSKKGKWRICDLFCGTGALGFEAYSRGGDELYLVDQNTKLCRENATALKLETAKIIRSDVLKVNLDFSQFDLIFIDPPYRLDLVAQTLKMLKNYCSKDGIVIVEHESSLELDIMAFECLRKIKTKRSIIQFFKKIS